MQWLVNTSPTFQLDVGSESVGTVTVDITRADGTLLVDGGSTVDNDDGTYDYNLSVDDNDQLDLLKVEWTLTSTSEVLTTYEEIVGGLLFTVEQARAFKAKDDAQTALKPLGSANEYPDPRILAARAEITQDLESWTGRGWIPRYTRLELPGDSSYLLDVADGYARTSEGYNLDRPGRFNDIAEILSVTVGGSTVATSNVVVDGGMLRRTDGVWTARSTSDPLNVVVEYVYGQPTPNSAGRIGQLLLVDRLVPQTITDRALSVDSDYGTVRLIQPGGPQNNVSRIPEVNQWVRQNSYAAPFA